MFNFKLGQSTNVDLSSELLDASDFTPESLLALEYAHDISVQAFDPLIGLLAIGRLLLTWPPVSRSMRVDPLSSLSPTRTPYRNSHRYCMVDWVEGRTRTNQTLGYSYQIPGFRPVVQ